MTDTSWGTPKGTPPSPPLLDQQLCFDLVTASEAVLGAYQPGLAPLGLNYQQYLVLLVLWEHPELTIDGLAERLRLSTEVTTPIVRRMVANGLVARSVDGAADVTSVTLTDKANDLQADIYRIHCNMRDALGLSKEEFLALQAVLRRVTVASHGLSGTVTV